MPTTPLPALDIPQPARKRLELLCTQQNLAAQNAERAGTPLENSAEQTENILSSSFSLGTLKVDVLAINPHPAGGALSPASAAILLAETTRPTKNPLLIIATGAGASIPHGVDSLDALGAIFAAEIDKTRPLLVWAYGNCAGAVAYFAALADVVIAEADAHLFLTGPRVIQQTTGEVVEAHSFASSTIHARETGLVALTAADPTEAAIKVKNILQLSFTSTQKPAALLEEDFALTADSALNLSDATPGSVPKPNFLVNSEVAPDSELPQFADCSQVPDFQLPFMSTQPYDAWEIAAYISDANSLLPLWRAWPSGAISALARVGGKPVLLLASQTQIDSGALSTTGCKHLCRALNLATAWHLPVVNLVDTPGFKPGSASENAGILLAGAEVLRAWRKHLHAFKNPKKPENTGENLPAAQITVLVRKAFGGAFIALSSKGLSSQLDFAPVCQADIETGTAGNLTSASTPDSTTARRCANPRQVVLAWENAQIGVLGPQSLVSIIHRKSLARLEASGKDTRAIHAQIVDAESSKFPDFLQKAAINGIIDKIITPRQTRQILAKILG